MPDPRTELQRLLDHPPQDRPRPIAPGFTAAVMARVQRSAPAPAPGRTMRLGGWSIAAAVLAIVVLLPGSWPTDAADAPAAALDPASFAMLTDILVASFALGVLLLASRRSLA